MLNRFFGENTHLNLHLLGLAGIATGIPFNKVVMSISMMFIVLNLLLEGNFKFYWKNIKSNKIYLLILGFFLLHILSILWSDNLTYAFHDLNAKLPILVIPTILASRPLEKRIQLNIILVIFSCSVILISILNFGLYQHWFGNVIYDDIRGLSHFSSHIRYALIVSTVIGILLYFFKKSNSNQKIIVAFCIVWLMFYTLYSQVISGVLTLVTVVLIFWFFHFWEKYKTLAIAPIMLTFGFFMTLVFWIFQPSSFNASRDLDLTAKTIEGNNYAHVPELISPETNRPIHIYICIEELKRDWHLYSTIPFDSLDVKGQPISETIVRYLSSKNLRKDAVALKKLTVEEISEIENGITSANHKGLIGRLYGIKYQVINVKNPNGHSLLQRLKFWKTGWEIAKNNFLIGVGSGDVQNAFDKQYKNNDSLLTLQNRKRAHNYYLTILLSFGIFGLFYFLFLLHKFIRFNLVQKEIVAIVFISIILVSFLLEDTIETQTGVTFFALFYALYSYKYPKEGKS